MKNAGPADALAARPPPPVTPERPIPLDRLARMGLKTPQSADTPEYAESKALLRVLTDRTDDGGTLDLAGFQAYMRQHAPDWSANAVEAAFRAADLDGSQRLSRHEFAVLRRALVTFDPVTDGALEEFIEIRCRALFATHMSSPDQLNASARQALVRDLCGRRSHVEHVMSHLGFAMDDTSPPISYAQFRQAVREGKLREFALDVGDPPASAHRPPQLCLDPRHVHSHVPEERQRRAAAAGGSGGGVLWLTPSPMAAPEMAAPEMVLDEELRVDEAADWRGALATGRSTSRFRTAQQIVQAANRMASRIQSEADVDDRAWMAGGAALVELLDTSDPPTMAEMIKELSADVLRIAKAQPMVVQPPAPSKVFGDIHGQLRDLLMLLGRYGFPSHHGGDVETTSYVFNGDWVDRGAHQLEVVVLLFALKSLYPSRVFLVRGNHEFRQMSVGMQENGFRHHMAHHPAITALPEASGREAVYEAIHSTFDYLPLAARVAGAVLVLHGGIGDGTWGIADLAAVARPLQNEFHASVPRCAVQALWSDPADSDAVMAQGVHLSDVARGAFNMAHVGNVPGNVGFGSDVTRRFCEREGVRLIIRSHQFVPDGAKFMHGGHLVTLFSARNYTGSIPNDSALLLLAYDEQGRLRVRTKRLAHRV
jgi:diadenosine tetraphosphatase ApaH/serine/threonine PP2A family protein phosphatase